MILTFISGAVLGAIIFALVLKNNKNLQSLFNFISDKVEEKIEKKTGKDI